jgi:hypothetical protein
MSFVAGELSHRKTTRVEFRQSEDGSDKWSGNEEGGEIYAELQPGKYDYGRVLPDRMLYSMFGDDPCVESWGLGIYKLDESSSDEKCKVEGYAGDGYGGSRVSISIHLSPERFDKISEAINARLEGAFQLDIGGADGFFKAVNASFFDESKSTKILCERDEEVVVYPPGCDIRPTVLGAVAEFTISIVQKNTVNANGVATLKKIEDRFSSFQRRMPEHSQYCRLVKEMLDAMRGRSIAEGLTVGQYEDRLSEAADVFSGLYSCLNPEDSMGGEDGGG